MQLTLKGFFFLLMFLFANHGQAQSSSQEYPNYLSGKQYFVKGEYRTARGFFDQVTKAGAIAPYALYYSAICSYHLGEKEVAKAVLGQIRQNYPEWKQLDEVLLWSGKIDLELELAEVAFLHFSRISSANIRQLATNIKQALVPGLSATTLSALNQAYPNDTLVARSLAAQLARQPLAVRNEALLKELRSRFSLSPAQLPQDLELKSQKKDEYHVAVFLPLFYRQQSPERTPKTIVSDFYNGLRMAWQDLNAATSQAKIHIHTYDTQRDSSLVARLMEKEEIKGMDLFIGPLLPETSLVAERYARLYQTNLINPLSDRPELFEGNPYGLKLVPSYMDQARAAAELVRTQRDHRYGMVFHGDNEKERLQAQEYARALELNNMEVVFMAEVNKHQGKFIFDTLTAERPKRYDENEGPRLVKAQKEEPVEKEVKHFYLRADSIGHIYLAGSNDVLAANVISAIGTRMDGITLIGNEDWLQFPSLSLDQMERLGICLVGSQFIHYQSAEALDFREKYLKTHGELPSKYAYLGYETLWFAGQQLRQSGTLFQAELMQKPFVNGKLSEGFCFYHSTTNTYVPLTKLEAGAPVLINPQP